MTKSNSSVKSTAIPKSPEEVQRERQHMYDVLFLLEQLFHREEASIKIILGCLYDVGAVNLINQKLQYRPLNRLGKGTARLSKPVFTVVAMRWFHKNVPQLLVKWLHGKVRFEAEGRVTEVVEQEIPASVSDAMDELVDPALPEATNLLPEGKAPLLSAPAATAGAPSIANLQTAPVPIASDGSAAPDGQRSPTVLQPYQDSVPIANSVANSSVVATIAAPQPSLTLSTQALQPQVGALTESDMMPRTAALAAMEEYRQEIARLRSRMNYLAIALISISGILGSALLWTITHPEGEAVEADMRQQPALTQPAMDQAE